jgi:hypothetical protein
VFQVLKEEGVLGLGLAALQAGVVADYEDGSSLGIAIWLDSIHSSSWGPRSSFID